MNSEDVCGSKNTNTKDVSTKLAGKKSWPAENEITHNSHQNPKLPPNLKTPAKIQNSLQNSKLPPKIKIPPQLKTPAKSQNFRQNIISPNISKNKFCDIREIFLIIL